ncbi:MAG: hypothetical protein SVV80_00305 [Planctomycetota bacterium]|nr:hypothetical protein [Planctomycetota bacterium]
MTDDVKNDDTQQAAHPADALADLADRSGGGGEIIVPNEQGKVNPISALDAMVQSNVVMSDPGEFAAAAAETVADGVSDEVFTGAASSLGASGGVHVTSGDGYHRRHAHMYKKTMIPLMLVVGAMLILVGFIAVDMVFRADPEQEFYTWYSRMKIVMYASFPLAAVVLAGAWWFHRDVNKATGTGRR